MKSSSCEKKPFVLVSTMTLAPPAKATATTSADAPNTNALFGPVTQLAIVLVIRVQIAFRCEVRWTFGGGKRERTAGIKVNSTARELRIPIPVNMPKVRTELTSKITSEKNPAAAASPAVTLAESSLESSSTTATTILEGALSLATPPNR